MSKRTLIMVNPFVEWFSMHVHYKVKWAYSKCCGNMEKKTMHFLDSSAVPLNLAYG